MNCSSMCPLTSEKILPATDGSEYSQGAIREALGFAKKCSSKLYALSVVEVITDYEAFFPQKVEEALEAGIKNISNRSYNLIVETAGDAEGQRIHRSLLQPAEEAGKAGIFIPCCLCEEVLSNEDCGMSKLVSTFDIRGQSAAATFFSKHTACAAIPSP